MLTKALKVFLKIEKEILFTWDSVIAKWHTLIEVETKSMLGNRKVRNFYGKKRGK